MFTQRFSNIGVYRFPSEGAVVITVWTFCRSGIAACTANYEKFVIQASGSLVFYVFSNFATIVAVDQHIVLILLKELDVSSGHAKLGVLVWCVCFGQIVSTSEKVMESFFLWFLV